jgi:hypothetical protein
VSTVTFYGWLCILKLQCSNRVSRGNDINNYILRMEIQIGSEHRIFMGVRPGCSFVLLPSYLISLWIDDSVFPYCDLLLESVSKTHSETCLNRTLSKQKTCLNRTLSKQKTCLNRTLSKQKTCLNQTDFTILWQFM